ncbi:MAG: ABC transporter ATP-binding protein [Acidilobaceae archaeon]
MARVEVSDLYVSYGSRDVLKGVALRAEEGEVVAVIGPNGAGKTTLLKTICGIVKPRRGRVLVEGVDVARAPRGVVAKLVGYVPQRVQVPEGLTVLEYVLTGRKPWIKLAPTSIDYEVSLRALKTVGAEHLAERDVSRVSGGELQLASIARALAVEPRVLLLDEPTTHLDLRHQIEVQEVVEKLARSEGITVVVSLHDLTQAMRMSDRVYVLNSGEVVAEGRPESVLTSELVEKVYGVKAMVLRQLRAVIPVSWRESSS